MNFSQKNDVRILVVDDEKTMADALVDCLSELGYGAVAAYGGHEGLAAFEKGDFQLVVTDLVMPEMDGMEMRDRALFWIRD